LNHSFFFFFFFFFTIVVLFRQGLVSDRLNPLSAFISNPREGTALDDFLS
jgi:hypothetical protein